MSAEAEGLQIPVSFTLNEARAALKELEASARAAGKRIGDGLDPKPVAGATSSLSKMKAEMGQAREAAFFFTAALGEFGPAGQLAQRAIGGIVGGIMGGGGLLVGLELGRVALSLVVDAFRAEQQRVIEIDRAIGQTVTTAQDRVKALRLELIRVQGGTAGVAVATFQADMRRLNAEIRAELASSEETFGKGSLNRTARFTELVEQRQALVKAMQDERRGIAEVDAARVEADRKAKEESAAASLEEQRRQWSGLALAEDIIAKRIQGEKDLTQAVVDETLKRRMEEAHPFAGDQFAQPGLGSLEQAELEARVAELQRLDVEARRVSETFRALRNEMVAMGASAGRALTNDVAHALTGVTRGSRAYQQAMHAAGGASVQAADLSAAAFAALAQSHLAGLAERATGEALWETAKGIAALAQAAWGDPRAAVAAALHFKSAAAYGALGLVAGAGAFGIGETRGMTADERASVAGAQQQGGAMPDQSGAREILPGGQPAGGGGGPTFNVYFSGRALTTDLEVKRALADLVGEAQDSGWLNLSRGGGRLGENTGAIYGPGLKRI